MNKTIKAGVIGYPISHSLSPLIHNYFLDKYQIDGIYEAIKVPKDDLKDSIKDLIDKNFAGFNVTIPHKESMFKICDKVSNSARLTGAVNTVVIMRDKKIFGHNSDVDGFLRNLKLTHPDFSIKNKIAFVIGAGGASRAIIYGLIANGVKRIYISNRDIKKINLIINDFKDLSLGKIESINFNQIEGKLNSCDLLINSTPLGMEGFPDLEINIKNLKPSAIIYDIVYKPLVTSLLRSAKAQSNKIVTGLGMLTNQALVGFELWFGKKAEIDENLNKILINEL